MEHYLNIHHKEQSSKYLGPYNRFILWLQGCDKNCKGCMSQESRRRDVYHLESVDDVLNEIKNTPGIEGVTVSGGEAMLQIPALTELLKKIKQEDLGVIVYTGYTLEQVKQLAGGEDILQYIDLLIDGPYIEELNDDLPYRGSSNQRLILLSHRYQNDMSFYQGKRECAVIIKDDSLQMIGVPSKDLLRLYYKVTGGSK